MDPAFICAMALAVDGDTLRCANVEAANGRVRLARIDAPELSDVQGEPAKQALADMLTGVVSCRHVDADPRIVGFQATDKYGRIVALCLAGGRDLGKAMLSAGYAQRWPREKRP